MLILRKNMRDTSFIPGNIHTIKQLRKVDIAIRKLVWLVKRKVAVVGIEKLAQRRKIPEFIVKEMDSENGNCENAKEYDFLYNSISSRKVKIN